MKKMLFLALAAISIFAASCEKKTLPEQMAEKFCNCQAVKDIIALEKSMEGKDEAAKQEAGVKAAELTGKIPACIGDLQKEVEALKPEEKEKFSKDADEALSKRCPEIAKVILNK